MKYAAYTLALVMLIATAPSSAFAKMVCKEHVEAEGSAAVLESAAPKKARAAWIKAVTARYGEYWNDWEKAEDRNDSYRCGRAYKYLHRCQARAKPCSEVPDDEAAAGMSSCAEIRSTDSKCDDFIVRVQTALRNEGCSPGTIDGVYGGGTRSALRCFQGKKNLPKTGELNPDTLALLKIE